MKRKSLAILGIIGAAALLTSFSMTIDAKELPPTSDHATAASYHDAVEQEKLALQGISDKYLEAAGIANEQYRLITLKYGESPMDPLVPYPQNYGGAYVNEEGRLVIQQVKSHQNDGQNLFDVLFDETNAYAASQELVLELVDFSYEDLNDGMRKINDYFLGDPSKEVIASFSGARVDDRVNRVVITITENDNNAIQRFREEVIDAPYLDFEFVDRAGEMNAGF